MRIRFNTFQGDFVPGICDFNVLRPSKQKEEKVVQVQHFLSRIGHGRGVKQKTK